MFLRFVACAVVTAFFLTGCVHSFEVRERHTAKASHVYTAGSSATGTGHTMLLFPDGRWEIWGSSCTEATLSSHGTYVISGKQITFFRKDGKPSTLEHFHFGGREYLATREDLRAIRKDPNGGAEYFALKRLR